MDRRSLSILEGKAFGSGVDPQVRKPAPVDYSSTFASKGRDIRRVFLPAGTRLTPLGNLPGGTMHQLIIIVVAVMCFGSAARAQSLTGTVLDPQGGGVPN